MNEPSCPFCDKQGLLIMPVRYAVAPQDMHLPPVSAPLKVEDTAQSVGKGKKQDLALRGSAQYTARIMRSGYLYVYDELRDRLSAYWITADGSFMQFPPELPIHPGAQSATPCDFDGHKELAGCIAIEDAGHAGIVWLGFSDVQWTAAVIRAHRGSAGKAQRELHMRAFDAGAWAKAHKTTPGQPASGKRGGTPHAVPLTVLADTVAEYAPVSSAVKAASKPFIPDTAPFSHMHAYHRSDGGKALASFDAGAMLAACERRSPGMQAAIVALDDPSGIARDLAALIQWHQDRLLDTPVPKNRFGNGYGYATTYRNLVALEGSLKALKCSNDEKVKLQVFADREALADYMKLSYEVAREQLAEMEREKAAERAATSSMPGRPVLPGSFPAKPTAEELASQQKYDALLRNPTPKTIETAQTTSWTGYLGRTVINQPRGPYTQWQTAFREASDTLQSQHITPLAQAHAAWLQSNRLANVLESTHDGADPFSGDVYAGTLHRCIGATQQIEGCRKVCETWLRGDVTDKCNLLLRALLLRQDGLIQLVAAAPLVPEGVPWQALMDQYATHLKALLKPDPTAPANAAASQKAEAKARAEYEDALADYMKAVNDHPGVAWSNNPVKSRMEKTEAAWKNSQSVAAQAKQDTNPKLLPDWAATVLVYTTSALATVLREFNGNAAEKKLMQWMVIVGVSLRSPVGVIEVNGNVGQTTRSLAKIFVANLVEAGRQSGKPLSNDLIRQLTTYAERQVRASFPAGNIGSFETQLGNKTRSKMAVFITPEMNRELDAIKDPTQKIRWLTEHVRTPMNLHEYGTLRVAQRRELYGSVSEGVLTVVDAIAKYASWQQCISDEASALPSQKAWTQDVRVTTGGALYVGALATGAGNVVKAYGNWRNVYAVGMVERLSAEKLVARATIALRVVGVLTGVIAGVYAVMDIVDAEQSYRESQWKLLSLQASSGTAGVIAAIVSIWAALASEGGATVIGSIGVLGTTISITLTMLGFVLAVLLAAIALWIAAVKGDKIAQWLERSYWGALNETARYADANVEQTDFNNVMAGA
ncbi:T6SS effector BTH_I2691 family protein [Paraburkholderia sp. JHI2823]|uniref:T6SS effector BTH_I2691 family protein n=1 Tax=Paraburkholderia sp. JHI2823 TaxID=3112960 RepID=UPI00317943BA